MVVLVSLLHHNVHHRQLTSSLWQYDFTAGVDANVQILALVVMTVAACEVCIGLGMIVALYRRRLPIDVDELRELQG